MRRTGAMWPGLAMALTLGCILTCGCESSQRLPTAWSDQASRLDSAHMQLQTDLPVELQEHVLNTAESLYDESSLAYGGVQPGKIRLRVFADQYDFGRYNGVQLPSRAELAREQARIEAKGFTVVGALIDTPAGQFHRTTLGGDEIALYYQDQFEGALRHELSHVFLREHVSSPPAWLDEGAAEYRRLAGDKRERDRHLEYIAQFLEHGGQLPLTEMLGWSHKRFYRDGMPAYAFAWLLVRQLIDEERSFDLRNPKDAERLGRELAARTSLAELLASARARSK